MINYCTCRNCVEGNEPNNPYVLYSKPYKLTDIELIFDIRAAALCRYGCERFKRKPTCPPNIPKSDFFEIAIKKYDNIYVLGRQYPYDDGMFQSHWRTYSTNEIHDRLITKERELFNQGYIYAKSFIGGSCKVCSSNSCNPSKCNIPKRGRVPLEATGVNVFHLIKSIGMDYQEPPKDFFWRIGVVFY